MAAAASAPAVMEEAVPAAADADAMVASEPDDPEAVASDAPAGCCLRSLPSELLVAAGSRLQAAAQPVGRLACTARWTMEGLSNEAGRLRVCSVVTCRLKTVVDGLSQVSSEDLEILRVDLSLESRECLHPGEVEEAVLSLGRCIAGAAALRVLALRLASFDVSMVRLRLSRASWEALVLGLEALARYQQLRSLELSSIAMKASQLTKAVGEAKTGCECPAARALPSPARALRRAASSPTRGAGVAAAAAAKGAVSGQSTLLGALGRLSSLEELSLTSDEIFGCTAQLLPSALSGLEKLRRLDLTRNHISKQVMRSLREEMPPSVELCGDGQQTFFFY